MVSEAAPEGLVSRPSGALPACPERRRTSASSVEPYSAGVEGSCSGFGEPLDQYKRRHRSRLDPSTSDAAASAAQDKGLKVEDVVAKLEQENLLDADGAQQVRDALAGGKSLDE